MNGFLFKIFIINNGMLAWASCVSHNTPFVEKTAHIYSCSTSHLIELNYINETIHKNQLRTENHSCELIVKICFVNTVFLFSFENFSEKNLLLPEIFIREKLCMFPFSFSIFFSFFFYFEILTLLKKPKKRREKNVVCCSVSTWMDMK